MDRIIEQGDVLLKIRTELPKKLKKVKVGARGYVLAHGESGHSHCITETKGVELYEDEKGTLWLKVTGESKQLVHEEHHAQTISPGVYEVGKVREVDPFEKAIRYVAD